MSILPHLWHNHFLHDHCLCFIELMNCLRHFMYRTRSTHTSYLSRNFARVLKVLRFRAALLKNNGRVGVLFCGEIGAH